MLQKQAQRLKETGALARESLPEGGRAGGPGSRPTRPRALPPHLLAHGPPRGRAVTIPPGFGFTSTRTVSGTQGATAGSVVLARLPSHARRPTAECQQLHLPTAPCRRPPGLSHTHTHARTRVVAGQVGRQRAQCSPHIGSGRQGQNEASGVWTAFSKWNMLGTRGISSACRIGRDTKDAEPGGQ